MLLGNPGEGKKCSMLLGNPEEGYEMLLNW